MKSPQFQLLFEILLPDLDLHGDLRAPKIGDLGENLPRSGLLPRKEGSTPP